MPAISIIVPVFNKEQYLPRCLDSILTQTFSDFEVLLVDDGSVDASRVICDEYSLKDSRIRVFHKANGGVSSARNMGISFAEGEYLVFVDADDYLEPMFLNTLQSYQEDFIVDSSDRRSAPNRAEVYYGKDAVKKALSGWQMLCVWGKKYKTEIIIKNNISFEEKLRGGEDTLFNLLYLLYSFSLRTLETSEYSYTVDADNSLSKSNISIEEAIYKAEQVYLIGEQIKAKYPNHSVEILISKYAGITWMLWNSLLSFQITVRARLLKQFFTSPHIVALMKNYLKCDESGKKYKLFYWLCKIKLYRVAAMIIP